MGSAYFIVQKSIVRKYKDWRRYSIPKITKVRDININQDGLIYAASQGDFGFFKSNKNNTLDFISLADSLDSELRDFDEVWRVFTKGSQSIFCTFNQLFIFDNNRFKEAISLESESESFFLVNNKLYIHSIETGLSLFNDNQISLFTMGDYFKNKTLTGILPLPNNHLWLATLNDGIFIFDGENYQPWNVSINEELKHAQINNCIRLSNGDIAIGTQSEGVYVIYG